MHLLESFFVKSSGMMKRSGNDGDGYCSLVMVPDMEMVMVMTKVMEMQMGW